MVYVNGAQPIVILELGEELLSNNSNICVIQSNWKWGQAAIEDLKTQIRLQERVLYLHNGTSDVQTPTDDKNAQSEPTNNFELGHNCSNCRYQDVLCDRCVNCDATNSGWEPKEKKIKKE